MCYPDIESIHDGMTMPAGYLTKTGYRLLTEAEWEYACRAGSETSRFYGDSDELLRQYAWSLKNANERSWPVGRLKPNDLGLFDMLGSVWNWTQDASEPYPAEFRTQPVLDVEQTTPIDDQTNRVMRGGSFDLGAAFIRSAIRHQELPSRRANTVGFRIARTVR
jgi:formylglycine-generating enzyme required for sulfatase activity